MTQYELDHCHFYACPGLAWGSSLKMTRVELQLMTDIELERGVRGGISQISNRYNEDDNPLLEHSDPSKPTSFLHYIDANNLFGHSMVQPLPTISFKFVSETEIQDLDILTIANDADTGYIVEVTLPTRASRLP